jgi:hypothetical protein
MARLDRADRAAPLMVDMEAPHLGEAPTSSTGVGAPTGLVVAVAVRLARAQSVSLAGTLEPAHGNFCCLA